MTDQQLYLSIGIPILLNGIALTIMSMLISSWITELATTLRCEMDGFRRQMEKQFTRLEERR